MIDVVDYRAEWPARFQELRSAYTDALAASGADARIEHVGSTAVPGLAAKPVIDVDIVVEAGDVGAATRALETIGFVARGELGVEGRFAFEAPEWFRPTNTYVIVDGSLPLKNHLAVRDVLRSDTGLRDEYAAVKRAAAATASGIDEYMGLKSSVLQRILARAGLSDIDRQEIAQTNRRITDRGAHG